MSERIHLRNTSFIRAKAVSMKKILTATAFALAFGSVQAADIVDAAKSAKSFDTLITAAKAAGLTDTLKGPGPFTVFAPTDEALAKIPKQSLTPC
jgi:uncharacterized surface protein with fasciclin (FAS1) repeats